MYLHTADGFNSPQADKDTSLGKASLDKSTCLLAGGSTRRLRERSIRSDLRVAWTTEIARGSSRIKLRKILTASGNPSPSLTLVFMIPATPSAATRSPKVAFRDLKRDIAVWARVV